MLLTLPVLLWVLSLHHEAALLSDMVRCWRFVCAVAEARVLWNSQDSSTTQGKPEEALRLIDRALAIDEKVLGPDHPYVAGDLNTKAELLRQMVSCCRFVRAVEDVEHTGCTVELIKLLHHAGQAGRSHGTA